MPATSGNNPNPLLQYLCTNCNALLRSTDTQIDRLTVNEDCPTCGTPLSQSLALKPEAVGLHSKLGQPEFKRANDYYPYYYPRLRYGIPQLDKVLSPLVAGNTLCISGPHATSLLEGLCCHSLLPLRAGGLESERVLYIDAGNTSQIYRFVRLARLYGLDYRDALRRVVQTRTFTIHQLASVIINELSSAVKSVKAKAVFVSDLFELFAREQNLDAKEGESLATQMAHALSKVASKCVLVVSLTRPSPYDRFLFKDNNGVKRLEFFAGNNNRAQYLYPGQKQISFCIPSDALVLGV